MTVQVHKEDLSFTVHVFKEGDVFIAYAPQLDVSSCGDTAPSARSNIQAAVSLFLAHGGARVLGGLRGRPGRSSPEMRRMRSFIRPSFTGPKYTSQSPSSTAEARRLLEASNTGTLAGRRDRALVSVMLYSFARVSAVIAMRRPDYFRQESRGWLRLHEKVGRTWLRKGL